VSHARSESEGYGESEAAASKPATASERYQYRAGCRSHVRHAAGLVLNDAERRRIDGVDGRVLKSTPLAAAMRDRTRSTVRLPSNDWER